MIDQFVYAVLLIASAQVLKSYPATPELGVFTMLMIVVIAVLLGIIDGEGD